MQTVKLPHFPEQHLQFCLFRNVQNTSFLRQQLLDGNTDFEYAFLDAAILLSRNHVLAACFRAINDQLNDRLRSRNVHSEIVFSLSPNNNVSEVCMFLCTDYVTRRLGWPRTPSEEKFLTFDGSLFPGFRTPLVSREYHGNSNH